LAASAQVKYAFTNFAGGAPGAANGTGSGASFNTPFGIARDASNNLYVTDYYNHTIRKISPDAVVTTLAGMPGSSGTTNGTGSAARFNRPDGIAADSAGNLFVCDYYNHSIRKITPDGTVTTFAGLSGQLGSNDGTGSAARFYFPAGLAIDPGGNIFVADRFNYRIRQITPGGVVTTIAGSSSGSFDGTNTLALFNLPTCIAVDNGTNLYVADTSNNTIRGMRRVGTNWVVTTLAGIAGQTGTNDGAWTAARFDTPRGLAFDSEGHLLVADSNNHTIRKMTLSGTNWVVTTLAGAPGSAGSTPGINGAARFDGPRYLVFDTAGNLFVADNGNYRICRGLAFGGPIIFGPATLGGGSFHLLVPNPSPGSDLVLESSSDLVGWSPVLTNNSASIQYSESPSGQVPRFFRAYSKQ
jgi:sugar lactone lactonase YvrE